MSNYITLTDNDIISMDESTGDIVVSVDHIPEERKDKNIVRIHYIEDEDNILHEYEIVDFDIDNRTANLKWVKQINTDLLMEGPMDAIKNIGNKIKNAIKPDFQTQLNNTEKEQSKRNDNSLKKLLLRDMGGEGKNWKFYFPDDDGKLMPEPVDQATARDLYKQMGNTVSDTVANAVVTTSDNYIVRRGSEDLYRQGKEFKPDNSASSSSKPTDKAEVEKPSSDDKKSEGDQQSQNRYNLGISSKTYGHFLKLLYVMRPKLFDAFDKPVDVTNIKELSDKVKYNNLADFEIEIQGKKIPVINWIKTAVKNKVLMENLLTESPVITLDDNDIMDPHYHNPVRKAIDRAVEKEIADKEAEAKTEIEQKLKEKYSHAIEKMNTSISKDDLPITTLDILFENLVPSSGAAETVAGELVRAMMRILYRDSNDGDKFFQGYGIETCGSSAEYLFDNGFDEDIQNMLDNAYQLADDDEKYTDAITLLAEHVVNRIAEDNSLVWTLNEEDSRDYTFDYIEENQPRYEYEIPGTVDIETLVDNDVLSSWDLVRYVEDQLEYNSAYEGAEVSRPWSHRDTSVTVANLTRDGYDLLHDTVIRNKEGFWEDLVSNYSDELLNNEYDDDYEESDDE